MRSEYPEAAKLSEQELKVGDIFLLALSVLKKRFGAFLLILLMFDLPAAAIMGYVNYNVPALPETEDPLVLAEALAESSWPVTAWELGLSFFTLFGSMTAVFLVYSELYEEKRLSLGEALYRGIRRWPQAALTLVMLTFGAAMALIAAAGIGAAFPAMTFLLLPFVLFYLVYYLLMKESSLTVAAHTGFSVWRNTACINLLYQGRFGRVLGTFFLILLAAGLPGALLTLLSGFFFAEIESDLVAVILSSAVSWALKIFPLFTTICTAILVNNYGDLQTKKLKGENS